MVPCGETSQGVSYMEALKGSVQFWVTEHGEEALLRGAAGTVLLAGVRRWLRDYHRRQGVPGPAKEKPSCVGIQRQKSLSQSLKHSGRQPSRHLCAQRDLINTGNGAIKFLIKNISIKHQGQFDWHQN